MSDSVVDPEAVKQASGILQRILHEEPEFWPYGLSMDQFDGGLYLLSKQAGSSDYLGFVGWQEREEEGRRVGYYAVGVLPEYRRQGMAKAAVQKLLRQKSAGVDEVRALVMSSNTPSQNLARTIPGVRLTLVEKIASMQKEAAMDQATKRQIASALLGAAASAGFYDQTANPDRTLADTAQFWKWDKPRAQQGVVNAALGALGGQQLASVKGAITPGDKGMHFGAGLAALLSPVAKDLMMKGQQSLHNSDAMMKAITEKANKPEKSITDVVSKPMLYGALGVGAGGIGLAGYLAFMKAQAAKAQAEAARGGRVRVTLPTKDPGDAETFLDMPLDEINLSRALKARLGRDTRRRLHEETRKRTTRRKPKDPAAPTAKEKEDMELEAEERELDKAAAPAQPAVPSPPGPGNPALRMTQQTAAANSIDTSTDANPQIMKAQQDAASASMDAQNQVAQAQQATQQQLMDQQTQFQGELQKADQAKQQVVQENQVLQMKLEQAKVESDLLASKFKAKEELAKAQAGAAAGDGDAKNSQLNQLIGSRLKRVQTNIAKAATTSPWGIEVDTKRNPPQPWEINALTGVKGQGHSLDPDTGLPKPPPMKALREDVSQTINRNGNEYAAQGGASPQHMYRVSYGSLGDMAYNHLLRPYLTTPPAPPEANLSAVGNLMRYGNRIMHEPRFA